MLIDPIKKRKKLCLTACENNVLVGDCPSRIPVDGLKYTYAVDLISYIVKLIYYSNCVLIERRNLSANTDSDSVDWPTWLWGRDAA